MRCAARRLEAFWFSVKSFLQFLLFVLVITLVLAGLYAWKSGRFDDAEKQSPAAQGVLPEVKPVVNSSRIPGLAVLDEELGRVAEAVIPSVVSISAIKDAPVVDVREQLLRQFFGNRQSPLMAETGSGVIVSSEGHIVTNLHVIDGATEVAVSLSDGQRLPGKLLGADPVSDIAILKIDAPGLRPLALADSEKVRVGQLVFAVGAPYGLQESVTMGIISARDRVVSSESANEFFQTDAPINPGNSGGPLVNIRGEVVAINNSIKTESGGNQGVAFSIPSNTAKRVLEQILEHGRVLRPYLGVVMLPLDADTARQLGLPDDRGAFVDAVFAGSPAAAAGLRRGDLILKFDGREIRSYRDLRKRVSEASVGRQAELEILRAGKSVKVPVTIVEQGQPAMATASGPAMPVAPGLVPGGALAGVTVQTVTPQLAAQLGLPSGVDGVVVQSIANGSPAMGILQPGDVIEQINDNPVSSPDDFVAVAGALGPGQRAITLLSRGRVRSFEVVGP
jgi:serine protease Do